MSDMTGRYVHGCSKCVFLGQYDKYDLYFCTGTETTLVCRFGNDGSDYASGMVFALVDDPEPAFKTALELALKTEHKDRIIEHLRKYEHREFPRRWQNLQNIIKGTGDNDAIANIPL